METHSEESIIEASIRYIKGHSVNWFSVDQLCAGLSISKRTFYSVFENKNKLVEKIITTLIHKWKKELSADRSSTSKSIKASFLEIYTYHLNEVISFNSDFLTGLRMKFPNEYVAMDQYFSEVQQRLLEILEEGRKMKKVKEGYNLRIFIEKEISFFEYLRRKHYVFPAKEDYITLLNLSLEAIVTEE